MALKKKKEKVSNVSSVTTTLFSPFAPIIVPIKGLSLQVELEARIHQTHTRAHTFWCIALGIRVEMWWVEAHFNREGWDTSGENSK